MIDKNDVKMPEQKQDASFAGNQEKINSIEELLRLVNDADNKQELRLKQDYYNRFQWFGGNSTDHRSRKSYFSYQEEAVYDFVFNLNKSGILSDQVGMGKTIEAGMIISELASRNELSSLLIVVPNEIMARKWEDELLSKFGVVEYNINGLVFPSVKSINNLEEFAHCAFECISEERFPALMEGLTEDLNSNRQVRPQYSFKHRYEDHPGSDKDTLASVIRSYIMEDIKKALRMINEGIEEYEDNDDGASIRVVFTGKEFVIEGTKFRLPYEYDSSGRIESFIKDSRSNRIAMTVNTMRFHEGYLRLLRQELDGLFTMIGQYCLSIADEIPPITKLIKNKYPILVIPKEFTDKKAGANVLTSPFLDHELVPEMPNFMHGYNIRDDEDQLKTVYESYHIIDFFIDAAYKTLIVDEVHDFIDARKFVPRDDFHANKRHREYPSTEYNRYELFDDYYFVPKECLYKKLKELADKADRKIFLTATPIKSDMVDFYLLTLLASNKDADSYRSISDNLNGVNSGFASMAEVEEMVSLLCDLFVRNIPVAVDYFKSFSSEFLREERRDGPAGSDLTDGEGKAPVVLTHRCVYPCFNNDFLRQHQKNAPHVEEYLTSYLNYMQMKELIMELIIAYNVETGEKESVVTVLDKLRRMLEHPQSSEKHLLTRIVFRTLLSNSIKARFEEDFTDEKGKYIKQIRDLLKKEEGPRLWHRTYRKYGIRHTRHQTYNLSGCSHLEKLNRNKMERYKNLPIWPRRDGKVIFIQRSDVFFDNFVNVERKAPEQNREEVKMNMLPNIDRLQCDEETKERNFKNAVAIFDYINDAMSGGDPVFHRPASSRYQSVGIDDAAMVDYRLAMVNYLMAGTDKDLGQISGKVLLFAENGRERILEWFRYQKLAPLYNEKQPLDPKKLEEFASEKGIWKRYNVEPAGSRWQVSENAEDLTLPGNVLVIIDPKRYEKGVDLQKANTMINFDINNCPLKMEQRIGRIDRIRPSNQDQQINIISFVPMNDMSGFVINFFANELKMFTQWMGETTGIVSVPDDEDDQLSREGKSLAFEKRVDDLQKLYNSIYTLCRNGAASDKDIAEMAKEFVNNFKTENAERVENDFRFIRDFRKCFDTAYCNSLSSYRLGAEVEKHPGTHVMRFNSSMNIFSSCLSDNCANCPNKESCNKSDNSNKKRNSSVEFATALEEFYKNGFDYYKKSKDKLEERKRGISIHGKNAATESLSLIEAWYNTRIEDFTDGKKATTELIKTMKLKEKGKESFTLPMSDFNKIFDPVKKLYWDDVVNHYISLIIARFHKQCDSVLESAVLFENFVKKMSIADFMNNMEGNG